MSVRHPHLDEPPPTWLTLLVIGLDRLRYVRTYGWFFVLTMALSLLPDIMPRTGASSIGSFAVTTATGLIGLFASLVLARQIMTGVLRPVPSDIQNAMRLFGFTTVIVAVTVLVVIIIVLVSQSEPSESKVFIWSMVAAIMYLVVRTSFYVPALAMSDPTSVFDSVVQSRPHWKRLGLIFLVVGGAGFLVNRIIEWLALPWILNSILESAVAAAGALLALAPACYLYWTHVRPGIQVSGP